MASQQKIKEIVKQKYAKIAKQAPPKDNCGCGCGCSEEVDYSVFSDSYEGMKGYVAEADLGLGCGLPTEYAAIKKGDVVVDLGSGAGNDAFVARAQTGEEGRVIGIDMTGEMIQQARNNTQKLGYQNVEFRLGDIENIPLPDNSTDVVISNCVLNLVPDKDKAFSETHRILKSGGHFCISDVVIRGELPPKLQESAEMYAGCVAGALSQEIYLEKISRAGFSGVEIKKSKEIDLPDEVLKHFLSTEEIKTFRNSEVGIFSITVVGFKN